VANQPKALTAAQFETDIAHGPEFTWAEFFITRRRKVAGFGLVVTGDDPRERVHFRGDVAHAIPKALLERAAELLRNAFDANEDLVVRGGGFGIGERHVAFGFDLLNKFGRIIRPCGR